MACRTCMETRSPAASRWPCERRSAGSAASVLHACDAWGAWGAWMRAWNGMEWSKTHEAARFGMQAAHERGKNGVRHASLRHG